VQELGQAVVRRRQAFAQVESADEVGDSQCLFLEARSLGMPAAVTIRHHLRKLVPEVEIPVEAQSTRAVEDGQPALELEKELALPRSDPAGSCRELRCRSGPQVAGPRSEVP